MRASLEGAPASWPMVIFLRSMDATWSLSRWPAADTKAKRTFFPGSEAARASARASLPTKTRFSVGLASRVSRTESSCVQRVTTKITS